jgi:hypothetical protein
MLMARLELDIPDYDPMLDPVRQVRAKIFPNSLFVDWSQDAELAGDLKKIGEKLHEEYLALRREERKRKNLLKEEEADVKTKKMQKRAEVEALVIKDEEFDEEKDDVPLSKRLKIQNGKLKNGHSTSYTNGAEEVDSEAEKTEVKEHKEEGKDAEDNNHDDCNEEKENRTTAL